MTGATPPGGRVLLGLRVNDQVSVAHRLVKDGELKDSIENEPAAARTTAVEAEHELVQVRLQVCRADRTLVGAEQPALGERGDPVHAGEQPVGVVAAQASGALTVADAGVAEALDP